MSSITILTIIPILSRDTIFSEATNEFVVKFATARTTKSVILALTIKDFVSNLEAVGAHGHVRPHKAKQESLVGGFVLPHWTAGDGVLVSTKETCTGVIEFSSSFSFTSVGGLVGSVSVTER